MFTVQLETYYKKVTNEKNTDAKQIRYKCSEAQHTETNEQDIEKQNTQNEEQKKVLIYDRIIFFFDKIFETNDKLPIQECEASVLNILECANTAENTYKILRNINFLNFKNSVIEAPFYFNINDLLLYHITKESTYSIKILKSVCPKTSKEKEEYMQHLHSLITNLDSFFNTIDTLSSVMEKIESEEECVLYINKKKQAILFSKKYYKNIEKSIEINEKKKIRHAQFHFRSCFNKICIKKKHLQLLKKVIKMVISIISRYIEKEQLCDDEIIDIYEMAHFMFNLIMFYIGYHVKTKEDEERKRKMDLKKVINNSMKSIKEVYNILKNTKFGSYESVKIHLQKISEYYIFTSDIISTILDRNYFSHFANSAQMKSEEREKHLSRQIYTLLKDLTLNIVLSDESILKKDEIDLKKEEGKREKEKKKKSFSRTSSMDVLMKVKKKIKIEDENVNDFKIDQKDENVNDFKIDETDEKDIVISVNSLFNLLTENEQITNEIPPKKSALQLTKKKHSNLYFNTISLLNKLKNNLKHSTAEEIVDELYYLCRAFETIIEKQKILLERYNQEKNEKTEKMNKTNCEQVEKTTTNESNIMNKTNEEKQLFVYARDLREIEKIINHILKSYKIKKNIKIENEYMLIDHIKKYFYNFIDMMKNEKKAIFVQRVLKCIGIYNKLGNKVKKKKKENYVIMYLLEFLQLIYYFPILKKRYSFFADIFFSSCLIKYVSVNELFNKKYEYQFSLIWKQFLFYYDVKNYVYEKREVETEYLNSCEKEAFVKDLLTKIKMCCNKKKASQNGCITKEEIKEYLKNTEAVVPINTFYIKELHNLVNNIFSYFKNCLINKNYKTFSKNKSNILLVLLQRTVDVLDITKAEWTMDEKILLVNMFEIIKFSDILYYLSSKRGGNFDIDINFLKTVDVLSLKLKQFQEIYKSCCKNLLKKSIFKMDLLKNIKIEEDKADCIEKKKNQTKLTEKKKEHYKNKKREELVNNVKCKEQDKRKKRKEIDNGKKQKKQSNNKKQKKMKDKMREEIKEKEAYIEKKNEKKRKAKVIETEKNNKKLKSNIINTNGKLKQKTEKGKL